MVWYNEDGVREVRCEASIIGLLFIFKYRESEQASEDFSSFELLHSGTVRGPLTVSKV